MDSDAAVCAPTGAGVGAVVGAWFSCVRFPLTTAHKGKVRDAAGA